ncbi:hypothetical protein OL548_17355 [Lysinibacillus sp. MHQ-1]|nr:hypothetical protein OL548_17355 [Lysinibacillus sp. MHQ-1]
MDYIGKYLTPAFFNCIIHFNYYEYRKANGGISNNQWAII